MGGYGADFGGVAGAVAPSGSGKKGLLAKYLEGDYSTKGADATAANAAASKSDAMATDADVHYKRYAKKHAKICTKKHVHKKSCGKAA
jgi:hypothetical protein